MLVGAVESWHPASHVCTRATFTTMVTHLQSILVIWLIVFMLHYEEHNGTDWTDELKHFSHLDRLSQSIWKIAFVCSVYKEELSDQMQMWQ